jgi:hypothetical protein
MGGRRIARNGTLLDPKGNVVRVGVLCTGVGGNVGAAYLVPSARRAPAAALRIKVA